LFKSLESSKEVDEDDYMPVKPTQYMLEQPQYYEKQEEQENRESFGEVHWFLDRKEKRRDNAKKLKLQFEEEDMCNLQDSQSELSLNKTLEFNKPFNVHGSV